MEQKTTEQNQKEKLHLQVIQKTYELMTSAFALVAALAWNDAIQTLFKSFLGDAGSLFAKVLYATIITFIVVYVSTRLSAITKAIQDRSQKPKNEETAR